MKALFCHTVRMLVRQRDILIWVVAFPLILATLFHVMFSHFDEYYRADPVDCVVVADDNYTSERAVFFREMIGELSKPGSDEQLLNVTEVESADEAQQAVLSGAAAASMSLDDEALPSLQVSPLATSTLDQTVVRTVCDRYRQIYGEMKQSFLNQASGGTDNAGAEGALREGGSGSGLPDGVSPDGSGFASSGDDISAFAQSPEAAQAAKAFVSDAVKTQQVSVLRTGSSGTVRYYYALLGFAAVMSITTAIAAVSAARANTAAVGARRQVSAMSPARQLFVCVAASFTVSFAALFLAFLFMRWVLGVDFGGREGLAVAALAVCALMATGLGAVIGAVPKIALPGKMGIATGLTCFCSLFAGLYGEPAMQLADHVAQNAPWASLVNPAVQAANAFYDLTYYDSLEPFCSTLAVLAVMAVVFFAAAAVLMRRQNYERL